MITFVSILVVVFAIIFYKAILPRICDRKTTKNLRALSGLMSMMFLLLGVIFLTILYVVS